jgi:hypothetical protein
MKPIVKFNLWRLLLAVMLVGAMTTYLASCGDDEPMDVDYYLDIQSTEAFKNAAADEQQGTASSSTTSVIYTSITRLQNALATAYPVRDTKGNDAAVISACDEVYRSYIESQGVIDGPVVCVVSLCKVRLEGGLVRSSIQLKTYRFRMASVDDGLFGQ